ncbi:Sugar transport protein 10 [Phytophthora nicotianae]|uniref:Sugar transport protein 10 n=1 Tax=Phytophthora nicotianae TaxID=4792 RepID=A0A0W8DU32_PHYNI|nr:Sugar transport protein 10 [Phytophthora nicotianae]
MLRVERLVQRLQALGPVGQRRGVLTIKKFTRPEISLKQTKPRVGAVVSDSIKATLGDVKTAGGSSTVRLAKRIAMSGLCSRREAEKRIQSFDVTVNGHVVADVATTVDVDKDVVAVDGRVLTKTQKIKVWMANKMKGVGRRRQGRKELVTNSDPQGRATIFDRLRVMGLTQHMMPVELKRGPLVDGVKYRPIKVTVQSTDKKDSWLQVKVTEGKNREVRKALAHVRLVVKRLIRVQYGPYRLADLPSGAVLEVRAKSLEKKQYRKRDDDKQR